ncbi:MAG: phosphate signaling complex protein PhoU [candidate division Zixibacteria bacterium]|nr:phosphate signaling complex protein PhoU [candidate division Zixibacteria bacterium]
MTKHYQHEIDRLNKKILHLTAMVEQNLHQAVKSITERSTDLAHKVIDADYEIDQMEVEVEEECLKILALYQPVAIDLRFIIAVLKINSDLERIGDLAGNIADRAILINSMPEHRVPFDLEEMLRLVVDMVKRSSDALVEMDGEIAREVMKSDDEIDRRHREAYLATMSRVKENPEAAEFYSNMFSVSRHLERIADHATNIAEDVIYMVSGDIVRHRGGII